METRGRHVIAELDGCDATLLASPSGIRRLLLDAARAAEVTVLADRTFQFPNGGVSGFILLAESHISIHTWPEHRYAAMDIYTCGRRAMPDTACASVAARLGATRVRITALDRGVPIASGYHSHFLSPVRREPGVPDPLPARHSA
jgi:S-adenosylmethionine decarboxylase